MLYVCAEKNLEHEGEDKAMNTVTEWKTVFNAISDAVCLLDKNNVIQSCNSAMMTLFQVSKADIIGKRCWEVVHGTGGRFAECPILAMAKTLRRESQNVHINGRWFEVTVDPILDKRGHLKQAVHIVHEITSQKQAQAQLEQTAERFRLMIDNAPLSAHLYELMPDGRMLFIGANESANKLLEFDTRFSIGKPIEEAFPMLSQNEIPDAFREVAFSGKPFYSDNVAYSDGRWRPAIAEVMAFQTAPNKIAVLFRDITDKKKAEEKLRRVQEEIYRERERLDVTLRSIGDGVITTDTNGRVTFINPIGEKITGWKASEAIGKRLLEVFVIVDEFTRKPCENPVEKVLKTGESVELSNHTLLIARDAREIILADRGSPIKDKEGNIFGVIVVFRDITEKQKMLAIMERNQKLESLGVLAGGIAHDFNNLLGGIFGFIDLARSDQNLDKKTSDYLESSMRVLARARGLTQQLLTFSKGGVPIRTIGSVEKTVREVTQFVLSGSSIAFRLFSDPELWNCEFDENQLNQVIDNVIINAQQAMPLGGVINITIMNYPIDKGNHQILQAGDYVRISIKDSGVGIPREILTRIFDPFFTTKQRGHGLGLAIAYSIIQKHNGGIDVESEPGKGTVVHIYLPASADRVARITPEVIEMITKSGRVLVMDDEEFIRETVSEMLDSLGFNVVCVKEGREALDRIEEERAIGHTFDIIICDLTVPGGLGGKEIVSKIRQTDELVPIIVSSGYSDNPVMANPKQFGFSASIAKPFTIKDLSTLLSSLLQKA